jgi:hypothetical protein
MLDVPIIEVKLLVIYGKPTKTIKRNMRKKKNRDAEKKDQEEKEAGVKEEAAKQHTQAPPETVDVSY